MRLKSRRLLKLNFKIKMANNFRKIPRQNKLQERFFVIIFSRLNHLIAKIDPITAHLLLKKKLIL